MAVRLALGVLAASLLSCASPPALPPENAAALYGALNGRFPKLPSVIQDAFDEKQTHPVRLEAALADYDPLLTDLARAAALSRCDWPVENPPRLRSDFPLDFVLTAGRVLHVRSGVRLGRRDVRGALADAAVLSSFAGHLHRTRSVIGQLLGCICIVWSSERVRDALYGGAVDRADLEAAERHWAARTAGVPTLDTVIRNERIAALSLIDDVASVGLNETIRRLSPEPGEKTDEPWITRRWNDRLRDTLRKDPDRARRIMGGRWDEHLGSLTAYRSGPLNSRPKTFESSQFVTQAQQQRMAAQAMGWGSEEAFLLDAADLLFLLWVPALTKLPQNLEMTRLFAEMTRVGCALELHRLRTGSFPGALSDLGPVPVDPFDGKPLRYRRVVAPEGEGYVVAAAGPDEDAEKRMSVVVDECRFDRDVYQRKGNALDGYLIWAFRKR